MKKLLKPISLSILFQSFVLFAAGQPQWKFHLAFEDATGAKDTIWFIWDTTATFYGLDTALGEYPVTLDYNVFNVWTYNPANEEYDTLKTIAHPYSYAFGHQIEAINFELPVKISWDSALFHADWLPQDSGWVYSASFDSDYFFWINNTDEHYFDLTKDDHTYSPDSTIVGTEEEDPWFWLPERNLPLWFGLSQDPILDISDVKFTDKDYLIFPNPVQSVLTIDTRKRISTIKIFNLQGKCLQVIKVRSFPLNIDFSGFGPGIYVIQLISNQNQYYHEKIIKTN